MVSFSSRALAALVVGASLAACSSPPRLVTEYKIDVQQGNVVTQDMVAQLKPGQTRDQVRFVLGTPLLTDVFHQQRWDYLYRYQRGATGQVQSRKLSVFFDEAGRLVRVAGDVDEASVEELTMPAVRSRMVDLGSLAPDAPASLPPREPPGFFSRMLNWIGF